MRLAALKAPDIPNLLAAMIKRDDLTRGRKREFIIKIMPIWRLGF